MSAAPGKKRQRDNDVAFSDRRVLRWSDVEAEAARRGVLPLDWATDATIAEQFQFEVVCRRAVHVAVADFG